MKMGQQYVNQADLSPSWAKLQTSPRVLPCCGPAVCFSTPPPQLGCLPASQAAGDSSGFEQTHLKAKAQPPSCFAFPHPTPCGPANLTPTQAAGGGAVTESAIPPAKTDRQGGSDGSAPRCQARGSGTWVQTRQCPLSAMETLASSEPSLSFLICKMDIKIIIFTSQNCCEDCMR